MKNFKKTTSNISAVIRSDYKRLSRSVVTVICVFGLALVPCLYAWFNIMSNWNPYTPDSTKNLKIAVASSDEGTDFVGLKLNVGELILDKLKANDQIDWQFPDSVQEVMDGLYAGDYYAGLIIPEDFSASMLGFTDGEMDQPEIIYYDNQKMNAVASRVTDRAQGIIRNEINSIFVATIVDELSNFTSVFNGMGLSAENALESLDNKLGSIKSDLKTYAAIMDSMSTVTKSAATVTSMTNDLLPDVTNMLVNSRKTIVDIQDRLSNSKQDVVYAADAIRNTSEEMRNTMERLDSAVDGDPAEAGGTYIDWDSVFGEGGITQYEGEILDDLYADVNKQLHKSVIEFDDIIQKTKIDKNLISSMSTLQDSLKNLDSLLAKVEGDVDSQSMTLQQYTDALNSCTVSIESTEDVLNYMVSMVSNLQSSINELRTSESFTKLIDLLQDDVGGLVEYLASPANLEVVRVYALENFGFRHGSVLHDTRTVRKRTSERKPYAHSYQAQKRYPESQHDRGFLRQIFCLLYDRAVYGAYYRTRQPVLHRNSVLCTVPVLAGRCRCKSPVHFDKLRFCICLRQYRRGAGNYRPCYSGRRLRRHLPLGNVA